MSQTRMAHIFSMQQSPRLCANAQTQEDWFDELQQLAYDSYRC